MCSNARQPTAPHGPYDDPYRFGPVLGEMDEYLISEGTHQRLWQVLGAHVMTHEGADGTHFAVWAPAARGSPWSASSTTGTGAATRCARAAPPGMGDLPARLGEGAVYKYEIVGPTARSCP